LAFSEEIYAQKAVKDHICLCRNEDILLPNADILVMSDHQFDKIDGFELIFEKKADSFQVGYNRFNRNEEMFGRLTITGTLFQKNIYE
jgi:hypothetical protein